MVRDAINDGPVGTYDLENNFFFLLFYVQGRMRYEQGKPAICVEILLPLISGFLQ